MIHALLKGRSPRFIVERTPSGAFAVSDTVERCLASGPWPSQSQAAYECDRMRWPTYHTGEARPAWCNLDEVRRATWERNATPRTWPESI